MTVQVHLEARQVSRFGKILIINWLHALLPPPEGLAGWCIACFTLRGRRMPDVTVRGADSSLPPRLRVCGHGEEKVGMVQT